VIERQRDEMHQMRSPMQELWQSVILIGLMVSSLGAYVGLAFAAVRLFSSR
jgi:hypothetical protein